MVITDCAKLQPVQQGGAGKDGTTPFGEDVTTTQRNQDNKEFSSPPAGISSPASLVPIGNGRSSVSKCFPVLFLICSGLCIPGLSLDSSSSIILKKRRKSPSETPSPGSLSSSFAPWCQFRSAFCVVLESHGLAPALELITKGDIMKTKLFLVLFVATMAISSVAYAQVHYYPLPQPQQQGGYYQQPQQQGVYQQPPPQQSQSNQYYQNHMNQMRQEQNEYWQRQHNYVPPDRSSSYPRRY
jgi:hypothetical protein